jgi:GMP synthase-like glutamine amidotransferase
MTRRIFLLLAAGLLPAAAGYFIGQAGKGDALPRPGFNPNSAIRSGAGGDSLAVAGLCGSQSLYLNDTGQETRSLATAMEVAHGPLPIAVFGFKAPLIGIASLTSDTYVRAVLQAGGIPVVLPNADGNTGRIDEYLQLLDGLIMPGGADIPPSEWGEEPHPTTKLLDENRYRFEKALITRWIKETNKPLLGICLGSQWINVAHGGSLVQDIPSEFNVNHRDVSHPVTLEPGSKLREIFGEDTFEVNSLHCAQAKSSARCAVESPISSNIKPHTA